MVADKRKPRDKPPPYQRQSKKPKVNDTPATSAQLATHTAARQNLTLNDWLTVFAYIDAHPAISKCDIVNHFKSLQSGASVFTQSTLITVVRQVIEVESDEEDDPQRGLSRGNAYAVSATRSRLPPVRKC